MIVGPITLAVSSIDRLAAFYIDAIGFTLLSRNATECTLGLNGTPFLQLQHAPHATAHPRAPGLFHLALLLPSRTELALALRHLAHAGVRLQGASDHLVSEALYLADPDGNGIELYCDRPRNEWPYRGGILQMATEPLDLHALLAAAPGSATWSGLPKETILGHIHLQVNDVQAAITFYRDIIGLDLTTTYGAAAAFFSFGDYHHHLAVNAWNSRGAEPKQGLGLQMFTLSVPHLSPLTLRLAAQKIDFAQTSNGIELDDPSGNRLRLIPTAASDD